MPAASMVDELLRAVARRLRIERTRRALQIAAWLACAVMLACVAIHVLARALPPALPLLIALAGFAAALLLPWLRRSDRASAAAWADRHLDAASTFGTLLEFEHAAPRPAQGWLQRNAPAMAADCRARLQQLPHAGRLSRALLTCAIALAFASAALQLPGRDSAMRHDPTRNAARDADTVAGTPQSMSEDAVGGSRADHARAPDQQAPQPPADPDAGTVLARASESAANARTLEDPALETISGAEGSASSGHSAGRDAGLGLDRGEGSSDAEPVEAALGARLQQLLAGARPQDQRVDLSQAAEYSAIAPDDRAQQHAPTAIAAAGPPPPDFTETPGPALAAYLRAYSAARTTTR